MRVGIVGGTFDPIHLGHLLIAEEARSLLGLEEIVFIPTGQPWMKDARPLTIGHHRLNMVRLGTASNPFFRASSVEIDRPGLTYSVDTLRDLRKQAGPGVDFYLVLGSDSLEGFQSWKEPAEILELCNLVVAPRPGCGTLTPAFLDEIRPSASRNVVCLQGPVIDISGTEIRRRVSHGLSVRYQVPEGVEHYMHRYGLYADGEPS